MDGSNCEGPEILPYVQAKNLTSHSLKDASRRQETSGSEMKEHVLLKATPMVSPLLCPHSSTIRSCKAVLKGPRIPLGADLQKMDPELSKLQSFTKGSKQTVQPLLWKETLSACHYSSLYSIFEMMVQNKRLYLQHMQKS